MTITKDEIKNILKNTEKGSEILDYIAELEENRCKCKNGDGHHHHHHDDECDCGCHDHDEEWNELKLSEYNFQISVEDWEILLKDNTVFDKDALIIMKRMRHVSAPTTYAEIADMFGYGAVFYSMEIEKLSQKLIEELKITSLDKDNCWAVLLNCWENKETEERIYALRPELYEAIGNVDFSNIPLR